MRIQKLVFMLLTMVIMGIASLSVTAQTTPTATPTTTATATTAAATTAITPSPPPPTLPSQATIAATPTQSFPLPITQNVNYIIQPRDTLDGIGALFDVSIDCLYTTNNLRPTDILQPEQILIISVDCPSYDGLQIVEYPRLDAPGLTGEDGTYAVKRNDTLDTIGQELNISVEALMQANNIEDPRSLRIGDILEIPEDAPPYGVVPPRRTLAPDETEEAGTNQSASVDEDQYVVQRGDTLDTIAQDLNISLEAIIDANNIENPREIFPGDVINIPEDAPPYGVVPPRRTLSPDDEDAEVQTNAEQPLLDEGQYIVQPGDTLDTIGQEYDISVVALQVENNIEDPRSLLPGDVLVIPEDAPPYGVFPALETVEPEGTEEVGAASVEGEEYVIQPGDTLDTIGQELNVSVIAIRQANDIDSALDLRPGTAIIIPAGAPPYGTTPGTGEAAGAAIAPGEQYVIQPGDTLDQIAESYNVDPLCLLQQNAIELADVYYIKPGQIIGIPQNCPEYNGFYIVPEGVTPTSPASNTSPLQMTPTFTPTPTATSGS